MKMVFYEIKKVCCKKVFIVILLLSFVVNIGLFYYSQYNGANKQYIFSKYPKIVSIYSEMPLDKAQQELNCKNKAYEILNLINSVADAQSEEELDSILAEIASYKEAEPQAYSLAEKMSKSTEYDGNNEEFVSSLLYQIEYINKYPSFINKMFDRAEEQSSFSIFSDAEDFSYKNLYKTAEDYNHLSDIDLKIGNDLPVTSATDYYFSNFFLIALVFLICIYLFVSEKELGLYNLVRSSKNGRSKTIFAKLCALFTLAAAITVLFSISNYFMSAYLYGDFELSRPIQSIAEFRNCTFKINIGEFCLLNMLGKVAAMIVISSIFALLFIIISNSSLTYLICMGIVFTEYIFKTSLPKDTVYNYLKYINIFYILDSKAFWGEYININIFSNPVTVCFLDIFVFAVIFVVCAVMTIIVFTIKTQNSSSGYISMFIEKIRFKHSKIKGNTSISFGELYKYFVLNKMIVIYILVAVVSISSATQICYYPYSDKSDPAYEEYMKYLEGDITAEKEKYIAEEQRYFDNLNSRLSELSNDKSLSESSKGVVINTINNIIETKGKAFNRITEQYKHLLLLKNDGINAKFIDDNLYPNFIFNSEREWSTFVLLLLMLLVTIPFIITVDFKKGMINLIRSTKYGKFKLIKNKIILGLLSLLAIFSAVYLPYFISFTKSFGTISLSTPIVCISTYNNTTGDVSVLQAFLLNTVCYFIIALLAITIIILVSVLIKNHMLSVIISTIILLLPCIVVYPLQSVRIGALFSFNYLLYMTIILLISVLLVLTGIMFSVIKFTNTRVRGKDNA